MPDSKLLPVLKFLVSLTLLLVAWRLVSGSGDPLATLRQTNLRTAFSAALVFALGQLAAGKRLQLIFVRLGRTVPTWTVWRAHFLGLWFNQVLPSGVGGDIVKVLTLRRKGDTKRFARGVLLSRMFGMLTLFCAAVLILPWLPALATNVRPFLAIGAVSLGGLIGFAGILWYSRRPRRPTLPRPLRFLTLVLRDAGGLLSSRAFWEILVTSTLVLLSVCLCFHLLGRSLGQQVGFTAYLLAAPPIILSMHVPLSYGGWGIREVGAVALLPLVGVARDAALVISVLYGLVIATTGLIGLLLWHVPEGLLPGEKETGAANG